MAQISSTKIAKYKRELNKIAKASKKLLKAVEKSLGAMGGVRRQPKALRAKTAKLKNAKRDRHGKIYPALKSSQIKVGWSPATVRKLRKMILSGVSVREVAHKLKKQVVTIRQRLFVEGIKVRDIRKALAKGATPTHTPKVLPKARRKKARKVRGRRPVSVRIVKVAGKRGRKPLAAQNGQTKLVEANPSGFFAPAQPDQKGN